MKIFLNRARLGVKATGEYEEKGYFFTGDYLKSLGRVSVLSVKRVFPGHHSPDIRPDLLVRMRDGFRWLKEKEKLRMEAVLLIMGIGRFGCKKIGSQMIGKLRKER